MTNFNFHIPTEVIFGKNAENKIGDLCKKHNFSRILLMYGSERIHKTGLLQNVEKCLNEHNITFEKIGGVVPNPRISLVNEATKIAKRMNAQCILAIGGGSVIDSAKACALATYNDIEDAWDMYDKKIAPTSALPVASILTIAAAGSETSNSSVLSHDKSDLKRSYNHECIRPVFAIMNPEITYTLPAYQTFSGVVDIIMHTLERYLCDVENATYVTDKLSEALMKAVMESAKKLLKDPHDYATRAEIMWAGSLSHNGLTGVGKNVSMVCHQLEHELSGMFDVAHGAGLSAIWSTWAKYAYRDALDKFVNLAVNVLDVCPDDKSDDDIALEGISKMDEFFKLINMPTNLKELGIINLSQDQILTLAHSTTFFGKRTIGTFKVLDESDIINIFRNAYN